MHNEDCNNETSYYASTGDFGQMHEEIVALVPKRPLDSFLDGTKLHVSFLDVANKIGPGTHNPCFKSAAPGSFLDNK